MHPDASQTTVTDLLNTQYTMSLHQNKSFRLGTTVKEDNHLIETLVHKTHMYIYIQMCKNSQNIFSLYDLNNENAVCWKYIGRRQCGDFRVFFPPLLCLNNKQKNADIIHDVCSHKITDPAFEIWSHMVTGDTFEKHVATRCKQQCLGWTRDGC